MKSLMSFFEIPAQEFNRAVAFYQHVLDIQMEAFEEETEKMAFFPVEEGSSVSGAISWAQDFKPSGDGVLIHLDVEDMEAALRRIEANGGKVIRPKTKIECEGRGYFALFLDTEGNRLGLYADK